MNRRLFLPLLAAVFILVNLALAEDSTETILHDDLERTYNLYVPESYDAADAVPLVVALHPAGGGAAGMASLTGLNALAETENFIVAYPEGPYGYWDYGADLPEWAAVEGVLDDPGFVTAMIDELMATYNIDAARVYAVGYSNGARMAYRMACDLPDVIAAIGTVAATISDDITDACSEGGHVSVIYLHGDMDTVIPTFGKPLHMPDGSFIANALSTRQTARFWAGQNDCSTEPVVSEVFDEAPLVQEIFYADCEAGTEVAFYGFESGGHSWTQDARVDTLQLIWDFFLAHPREVEAK